MKNNPKLEGSNIIDCIPQVGDCPNGCASCYYNAEGFFTDKKTPLIPSLEEVGDKIVRVNSGHDSNIQKELVLESTKQYKKVFYSTSIPRFDFPGPVVFTVNGKHTDEAFLLTSNIKNIMMVRFRTNPWNLDLLKETIDFYTIKRNIPTTITFMRYQKKEQIPEEHLDKFELKKNILNEYYVLNREHKHIIMMNNIIDHRVGTCGTLDSSFCKDCRRCEELYERKIDMDFRLLCS